MLTQVGTARGRQVGGTEGPVHQYTSSGVNESRWLFEESRI
jgi:hypothetical protein